MSSLPLSPQSSFLSPSLPSFLPHGLSASLSTSPRNQCTRGALLGVPVVCQRWTLGFRDPRPVGGVSSLSSVLDSMFMWKPVKLQLRCDSVFVGA